MNKHVEPVRLQRYVQSPDYTKSPFRYPGGKFYALKFILPFIQCVPHDEFREPFVGGGSVFFAKTKAETNWINDLEEDLIETYRVMQNPLKRQRLIELLSCEVASRKRHSEVKELPVTADVEVAFKTYYLNRTSYSGIIHKPAWGYREGKSAPPESWIKFVEEAGTKLEGIEITSLDFREVIVADGKGTVLMYLDPPYYHADQKRAYTKPFSENDHLRLAEILRQTSHLFCLSYDDCSEVRDLYSWAYIYERAWLYNTANINGQSRKLGNELIITNYAVTAGKEPTQLSLV